MNQAAALTKKDFASGQDVRWCPGCGDYAILSSIQTVLPQIGVPKEKIVFVSGIGCSSRFPHYLSTYGFHTIHGRAPAIASGLKLSNPDLSVWVITGDGDGLSIGTNHLAHAIRRNISLKILLFNNNIYGLTKGQASPTSKLGTKSKSTPYGSLDVPFEPVTFAIACGATFVARTMGTDPKHMQEVFRRAAEHNGVAFVEILQNCVIFNDKVHAEITDPEHRHTNQLRLVDGQPMRFGAEGKQGLTFNPQSFELEEVTLGENGVSEKDILIHRENSSNKAFATLLAGLKSPTALGVLRCTKNVPTCEDSTHQQIKHVQNLKGQGDLRKLIHSGNTWVIN